MRIVILALSVVLSALPACAQAPDQSGPQEVGTTTMPPGQYFVTEQISKKSYSLTVTQKGNMILGPAPEGLEVKMTAAPAAPAAPPAAAVPATPAAGAAAAAPGAAPAAAPAGAQSSLLPTGVAGDVMKGLVKQGMQKGVNELMKQGANTKQLQKLIK